MVTRYGRVKRAEREAAFKHIPRLTEMDAITENAVLDGRLRLLQPERGYRAGLDAALLAAACDAEPAARVLEAGCGVGAALLAAAVRRPGTRFAGVERDPAAAALARRNVELNGLSDRVEILGGDVAQGFRALGRPPFDAALANPPFFDDPAALRAPAPARRGAWIADDGLAAWTAFLLKAVREGGTITVIHRADRLADLLALLAPKAGSFQIRPIHPFADQPAKRVLLRAVKTGKAPLRLLPPLVLHARDGAKHAPEAEAILRGQADLGWG
jgi:tRNA1(Val) A37 N6-methylase TrmN6